MRLYDKALVSKLREKEYTKNVDGVDILFKPVPDDDRGHVIDPRLLEIIKNKKNMFSTRAKVGYSLANIRYRPDKITYDLTKIEVSCEERLIRSTQIIGLTSSYIVQIPKRRLFLYLCICMAAVLLPVI